MNRAEAGESSRPTKIRFRAFDMTYSASQTNHTLQIILCFLTQNRNRANFHIRPWGGGGGANFPIRWQSERAASRTAWTIYHYSRPSPQLIAPSDISVASERSTSATNNFHRHEPLSFFLPLGRRHRHVGCGLGASSPPSPPCFRRPCIAAAYPSSCQCKIKRPKMRWPEYITVAVAI